MTISYHLQKVPVEYVQPGFCLAVRHDGRYRLFQVECMQMSHRRGQPVTFKLTSEPIDGGDPWVVKYQAGTAVIRIRGAYTAAS
jgi:hypothetical protein